MNLIQSVASPSHWPLLFRLVRYLLQEHIQGVISALRHFKIRMFAISRYPLVHPVVYFNKIFPEKMDVVCKQVQGSLKKE